MKREDKRELQRIAKKIAECEKALAAGKNVPENQRKIEQLSENLDLEQMLYIDDFILRHNLTL